MRKILTLLPFVLLCTHAQASTSYGSLNNFDAVNDTGETCYGFEIEIDDTRSSEISYTYDYNHYSTPKIREDSTDPLHPKVFVRYEGGVGSTTAFTNPAVPGVISPTNGHMCTNPAVNQGCEHFGVGYYGNKTIKYNWLVARAGAIVQGPAVNVGTPVWNYIPPVFAPPVPNQPPMIQVQAQAIAAIPAPIVPIPPAKQYGSPSWVKVIKTTAHKAKPLALKDLVGDDNDHDGHADWTNGEPDEVESEWYLLQTNNQGNANKGQKQGNGDKIGDGKETVTRRYEFYAYTAGDASIDGENGEAMCDNVATDNIHGSGIVDVTDANGGSYPFDCANVSVVGNYLGAQMAGFNAVAPFGLIDHIQDGRVAEQFPNRTIPAGGNSPYSTVVSLGTLPHGLLIQDKTGIVYGVPTKVGIFNFTITANDTDGTSTSKAYTVKVAGPGDIDGDYDIDSNDLAVIKAKYGQNVQANDPADMNGDLRINVLDYRKAAAACTRVKCAV